MERLTRRVCGSVLIADDIDGKYTAAKVIDILAERLAEYEETGLTPAQIEFMQEENVKLTTPDTVRIRKLERIAEQAEKHGGIEHLVALDQAAMEGRLWVAPCKMDDPLYMVVTKRPKLNWPEFSFIKATFLTENNFFRVIRDFGKTVFLTHQEASDALEKIKED